MSSELEYHLSRARTERGIAYRSADPCVSDAHMRLSVLHLQRALLLQEVRRAPVGNVTPFKRDDSDGPGSGLFGIPGRIVELHG